jgi:hypothetical protein
VATSIELKGDFVEALVHAPLSVSLPSVLVPILIKAPIRFLEAAVLVSLGRFLIKNSNAGPSQELTAPDPEPVA